MTHRLTRAREHLGITKAELARRAGVSRATITRIEKGERSPSIELLQTLQSIFDWTTIDPSDWKVAEKFRRRS